MVVESAGARGDMCLDLLSGSFRIARRTSDLKDRVAIAARSHDVRARLLLDTLDSGAFGTHHQAHHTVRHAHLDCGLTRKKGGRRTIK